MGQIYGGPYADEIGHHEGYANREMPDGEWSMGEWSMGEWSTRYPSDGHGRHVAFVGQCDCGWRSEIKRPPTDQGEEAAYDDWNLEHLRPMVRAAASRHTVSAVDLLDWLAEMRKTLRFVDEDQDEPTERSRGVIDAIYALEVRLDELAERETNG